MSDLLADLERRLLGRLQTELPQARAVQIAADVVADCRFHWAGTRPYIPATVRDRRNAAILERWRVQREAGPVDRNQLAQQFNVHRSTIDRVIAAHLAAIRSPFG